jgi:hypothetical protein
MMLKEAVGSFVGSPLEEGEHTFPSRELAGWVPGRAGSCLDDDGPESWRLPPLQPGRMWYDVTLWCRSGDGYFPLRDGAMLSVNAFAAIEDMMRYYQITRVVYATAYAFDRSIIFRAYRLYVPPLLEEDLR